MKLDWSRLDGARAKAHSLMDRLPGKAGDLARKANEALGRPLANADELADRRAFGSTRRGDMTTVSASSASANPSREAAPVVVFHMDKTRRDAQKLTELLDGAGIPYKLSNIQEDPAAQAAVRRDSNGYRLPVVFVAGEPIGGRAELTNLLGNGELKKKVWPS